MKKVLLISILVISISKLLKAQNDCPNFPKYGKFDTLSFIKTEIPTDTINSKKAGNIYLGQGYVKMPNRNYVSPVFIPNNHPTWALAVAHAWNYHRNIIKRVNYPQIGSFLATVLQETELGCVTGATWDSTKQISPNQANANTNMTNNGCYQFDGTNGYNFLNQAYLSGRFPENKYDALVQSTTGFETSSLLKTYYDLYTSIIYNYNLGWKIFECIDCTKDKYAYVKSMASAYNGGTYSFQANSSFFNHSRDADQNWTGFQLTVASYPEYVGYWTSALENDKKYLGYPAGSSFDSYYNKNISWQTVIDYLNIIKFMYPEIDFTYVLTPRVQAAYVKIAGSTSATIPFMKLGPVIDQIILNLPAEYPKSVGSSSNNSICSGNVLPYGHIEIKTGGNNLQQGESVTLNIVVDNGYKDGLTYKWFEGNNTAGTPIATTAQYTVNAYELGKKTYVAQVCDGNNCYQLGTNAFNSCTDSVNNGGINTTVTKTSTCSLSLGLGGGNTTCKGMKDGSVGIQISSVPTSYIATYRVINDYGVSFGTLNQTSGNYLVANNLIYGDYTFKITDANDSTCFAFGSTKIGYNTNANEIVIASLDSIADCKANMSAKIEVPKTPCTLKVQAYSTYFFNWYDNIYLQTQINQGSKNIDGKTRRAIRPEIETWIDVDVSEKTLSVFSGDTIHLNLLNNPLSSSGTFVVRILNSSNSVLKTYSNVSTSTSPSLVGNYVVSCPVTSPTAYTFTWTPAVLTQNESPVNNATMSKTTAQVSAINPYEYTVTALSKVNSNCMYTDVVKVLPNISCSTTGIENEIQKEKTLIKIYNFMGQEIAPQNATHGLFIYLYSDGSTEKILK